MAGTIRTCSDQSKARVVTTTMVIKIVDKEPFSAILERYPNHAKTAGKIRVFFLNDFSLAPTKKSAVGHSVPYL